MRGINLSVMSGTLVGMTGTKGAIPRWVVPSTLKVNDCHRLDCQVAEVTGAHDTLGQILALEWVCGLRDAPLTDRAEQPVTRAMARAESWVALCDAAGQSDPTDGDWRQMGAAPLPAVISNAAFSYGAWRMLTWLLGERAEPPEELPQRDEDGTLPPWEQRYVARPNLGQWPRGWGHDGARRRPVWPAGERERHGDERPCPARSHIPPLHAAQGRRRAHSRLRDGRGKRA